MTVTNTAQNVVARQTWDDVKAQAERIAARNLKARAVWGIPTGGALVAMMVADAGLMTLLDAPPAIPAPDVLIVDDLIDSGRTLAPWVNDGYTVDACFRKPHSPGYAPSAALRNEWLSFPWERDEGAPTDAVTRLLEYLGEDPTREGLFDTPKRAVKALRELTAGYREDPTAHLATTFDNDGGYTGPVTVSGVGFTSLCEHHMLPFTGTATISYTPSDRIVGLSKLPRMFLGFASRLQVQERLTQQTLDAVVAALDPVSAFVEITASHSCMAIRGVKTPGAMTTRAEYNRAVEGA